MIIETKLGIELIIWFIVGYTESMLVSIGEERLNETN